ncbi:MAG: YciI family protein [Cyanophyceae cyanobacterium]
MPWFVKIESGTVRKSEFDRHVPAHLAYVKDLIAKGHQAQTGYWEHEEGGLLIFQAKDLEEARAIVAADPLVQNNCVTYELHQWHRVLPKENRPLT